MRRVGLFLAVEPSAGGMFQYAQSLLDALCSLPPDAYKIEVACTSDSWRPVLERYAISVTWLKHGKVGLLLADALMAARIPGKISRILSSLFNPLAWQLNRLDCAIWIFPAQDAIGYQLSLPVLVSIHDLMHRYERRFPEVAGGHRFHVREHRFRNLANWAKAILVDSEVGRSQVVHSYGIGSEKVYPLPYVPPRYIHQSYDETNFDSRYDLPAKFLFYPAQFWPHKNHQALISAAASIRTTCHDIHLVFTGEKRHGYDQIRAHALSLGMLDRIAFLGYVPDNDLQGLYRRARAMVMPTFLGPTNIPPLEALACDCPVAASAIYAMPEQLGDASLYFDPRSISEIGSTLERLWLDDALCETLREGGRRKTALWSQSQFNGLLAQILGRIFASSKTTP